LEDYHGIQGGRGAGATPDPPLDPPLYLSV
jgi:hypothetical protein